MRNGGTGRMSATGTTVRSGRSWTCSDVDLTETTLGLDV
jgi:hypothetical protein